MILEQLSNQSVDYDPGAPQVQGQWFPVRFIPDLVTGEVLNLGVGLVTDTGEVHTRMLDRFNGLECLYEGRLANSDVSMLLKTLSASFPSRASSLSDLGSPSPHVFFGDWQPISGATIESVLDSLYRQMVTLGARQEQAEEREKPERMPTDKVRERVFSAMKRFSDQANWIIAQEPQWLINEQDEVGRKRVLDMPLRGSGRFGTIISAVYKSSSTRQVNLFKGVMDLETALQIHPKEFGGVFVFRPDANVAGYDEETLQMIDNDIDQLAWRLRLHKNVRFEAEDDTSDIARHVLDWADVA